MVGSMLVEPSVLLPEEWPRRRPSIGHASDEAGAGWGLEDADHGGDDAAFLDEIDLLLEGFGGVLIESDDEAGLDFDAGALEGFDVGEHVAVAVLGLVAFLEGEGVGGFDADKDHVEAGVGHLAGEGGVVGEVDGGLGAEGDGAVGFLPMDEGGEEFFFEEGAMADEVVVDEEDAAAPAGGVDGVEFGDDLGGRFSCGACGRAWR